MRKPLARRPLKNRTDLTPVGLDAIVLRSLRLFFLCKFQKCLNSGYSKWPSFLTWKIVCLLQRCRILSKRAIGLIFVFIIFFPCFIKSSTSIFIMNGFLKDINSGSVFRKGWTQDVNISVSPSYFQEI